MYSFWYNAPTLLPTGGKVEMELISSISNLPPVGSNIGGKFEIELNSSISALSPVGNNIGALSKKLYTQSKNAPKDGWVCRRNM